MLSREYVDMEVDRDRITMLTSMMMENGLDALVCQLPQNVQMLSGYRPLLGESISLMLRDGRVFLIVPESEADLAQKGWAGSVRTFKSITLEYILDPRNVKRLLLTALAHELGLANLTVGYEAAPATVPATYVEFRLGAMEARDLYQAACPDARFVDATDLLLEAACVLTEREIQYLRQAAEVGKPVFEAARAAVSAGRSEQEIAACGAKTLYAGLPPESEGLPGAVFAMSGPRSEKAYLPYQSTKGREVEKGDLVVVHLNAQAHGFWTDLTRTFIAGEPNSKQKKVYQAILSARDAALSAIAHGVKARDVDAAARRVLNDAGLGAGFRHGTGHGVGFKGVSHTMKPVVHPVSGDVIVNGMVFNVEPAFYEEGFGGIRICDVVAVKNGGPEVLSEGIPADLDWAST